MRARTFVFALVCGTASVALAQDGGYVRFPSTSSQACAVACASDQMCASWSYGTAARSYGQNQSASGSGGMCTFSGSSVVRNSPGFVSGLPRRDATNGSIPMMSSAPPQNYGAQTGGQSATQSRSGASGWDVRPAPWLNNGSNAQNQTQAPARGQPQQLRPMPPQMTPQMPAMPSVTPSAAPQITYDAPVFQQPQAPQQAPIVRPPIMSAPAARPYIAPAPIYAPAPQVLPPTLPEPMQNRPIMTPPAPPPGTRDMQDSAIENGAGVEPPAISFSTPPVAAPPRPRPGRGVPKNRAARPASSAAPVDEAVTSGGEVQVTLPTRPIPDRAIPDRAIPARGTPRSSQATSPSASAALSGGAPPRQETAARPAPGRGTPRGPVRDPNNPESFRGADGMIDAAEMRRAQLNAAREQGAPAYSVQREWEAIAAERQRADDAGEVRADPLAGTSPVPPPPETRAQRRAREAEEAAVAAEEARANSANDDTVEDSPAATPSTSRRSPARGARGVPRPKATRQTSDASASRQVSQASPPRPSRASRRAPAQALDREPRLSGGPG